MDSTPIFQRTYDFYKNLYLTLRNIPKRDRFTWGERCETSTLELLKLISKTQYLQKQEKRSYLSQSSLLVDQLKIYLRLGQDLSILSQKQYIARQAELQEIGKMLGGWLRSM